METTVEVKSALERFIQQFKESGSNEQYCDELLAAINRFDDEYNSRGINFLMCAESEMQYSCHESLRLQGNITITFEMEGLYE